MKKSRTLEAQDAIPIPLREDLVVYVTGLPADLTAAEANKIARVVVAFSDSAWTEGEADQ